ncbi:hypothetical protein Hanom_Chr00s000003g01605331 [Helianthus anomalus]
MHISVNRHATMMMKSQMLLIIFLVKLRLTSTYTAKQASQHKLKPKNRSMLETFQRF